MAEGAKSNRHAGRKRKPEKINGQAIESKEKSKNNRKKPRKNDNRRKTGPRLPSSLRKDPSFAIPDRRGSDEDSDVEENGDVYEYEEGVPEEEKGRNRRFDPVDDVEYELPEDFEDEELPSDNDEEDEGAHLRMLEGITGMPADAFEGNQKVEPVFADSHSAFGGERPISIQDLLDPLHGKPGFSKLRKRLQDLEKKPMTVQAPLPKVQREKLEREVAYEHSKKEMTKWEPLVKKNREAPTIYFDEDVDIGYSTVGAIASEFKPRSEFEMKMAELVQNPEIAEAHRKDGDKILTLNKISIEDMKSVHNYRAKMKSLLFRHELKAKRIKKIKSKTYHRMLKKDKLKGGAAEGLMNPDVAKEEAMKREFKRAEERMTLKHKNSSKWAKRILKRGLNAQDDGTKAALTEQLHQHSLLTRKIESMKDGSSSDDSSDEDDDELSDTSLTGGTSKLLDKAKEKTLKVMEEEDEIPKSGLLSLPFMVRGLKKKNEALLEEGRAALEEYNSSLKALNDDKDTESPKDSAPSGRRVFGSSKTQSQNEDNEIDSEADYEAKTVDKPLEEKPRAIQQGGAFKHIEDIAKYDASIFDINFFGKDQNPVDVTINPSSSQKDTKVDFHDSDVDSEEEMVDGFLSAGAKTRGTRSTVDCAFDSKDVEGEFEKEKLELLTEEVPEPEKPVQLPGWGDWTGFQKKKGLPKWMLKEHDEAKRKREEVLKKRKDAHLKHVIISEKIDKKAERLHTKALPFPFTSKEVFEKSIRMPIGPEFNPAVSHSALNRPAVIKKPGVIIKPIQYEEVNVGENSSQPSEPSKTKQKRGKSQGKSLRKGKNS
ncbi:U3 ribonucleoprotein (Utp) family protein [Wolffia australiana]